MIYKLLTRDQWAALVRDGVFAGSADDRRDGYIHLSAFDQVAGTLAKYFADIDGVVLAEVEPARCGAALRWEPSRGGALFPHLYASLPMDLITRHWWLARGADGAYCLPDDLCA
ncbi:MAG: DUF952 domain-containing protein [Sphingomonadales bacterium]|nr:MAG: DUF952 domain-containing protein [Sphingomonadales bacterium]